MIRLDKLLCECNLGTRSQVKELLKKGQVSVNGEVMRRPETKVEETTALLCVQGREYRYRKFVYYMLHKPAGVVSATTDRRERTVLDLIQGISARDLFPVGRLDKDTEGLLLITNDGTLAHNLLAPGKHVEKTYLVESTTPLSKSAMKLLENGVDIGDDTLTRPAILEKKGETTWLLTITEGRYHQVKRMFEAAGSKVARLKRLRMGTLELDERLRPGEYRELTETERETLIRLRNNMT